MTIVQPKEYVTNSLRRFGDEHMCQRYEVTSYETERVFDAL